MKSLKEHILNPASEEMAIQSILEVMMIAFDEDGLNEAIINGEENLIIENMNDKINTVMGKGGFHVKKHKGLIGHLMSAGRSIAKLFIAIIHKDLDGVKAIMKSIKKEDVLDFLLDLDMATLHIISGPIHTLDAITGWHLWANVKEKAKGAEVAVRDAISKIKQYMSNVYDKVKAKVYTKYVIQMEKDLIKV